MSKQIVISIPVHEQPAVIANQLSNIKQFVSNCRVVLHSSADSPVNFHRELSQVLKSFSDFAFLNPTHFHTHSDHEAAFVTGLSTVHASNYQYIAKLFSFDTFAINTSNDMFVRHGLNQVIDQYQCGFTVSQCKPEDFGFPGYAEVISKFVPVKTMEKGSQEGLFFPAEVFKEVANIIPKIGTLVKAEEMYLPSLAFNLFPELYQSNSGEHYVYHNPAHAAITKEDIHKVQYGQLGKRFAVKRVPRQAGHPIRQYINQITQE